MSADQPDTAALIARLREYGGEVTHARDDAEPPYSNEFECGLVALEAADFIEKMTAGEREPSGRMHLQEFGLTPATKPTSYRGVALGVIRMGDRLMVAFDFNGTVRYLDSECRFDVVDLHHPFDLADSYLNAFKRLPEASDG